jgi:hypothetical protein
MAMKAPIEGIIGDRQARAQSEAAVTFGAAAEEYMAYIRADGRALATIEKTEFPSGRF